MSEFVEWAREKAVAELRKPFGAGPVDQFGVTKEIAFMRGAAWLASLLEQDEAVADRVRALAEASLENEFPDVRKPSPFTVGYIKGFIAGRTSVTREQIAEVLERKLGHAHRDAPYADLTEEAEAVLALLRGEVAGDG